MELEGAILLLLAMDTENYFVNKIKDWLRKDKCQVEQKNDGFQLFGLPENSLVGMKFVAGWLSAESQDISAGDKCDIK